MTTILCPICQERKHSPDDIRWIKYHGKCQRCELSERIGHQYTAQKTTHPCPFCGRIIAKDEICVCRKIISLKKEQNETK